MQKTFALVLLFSSTLLSFAQAQTAYTVTSRGADFKVLSKTTVENGTNRVHSYTELATGMNYTNSSGQWVEATDAIDLLPDGTAAAVHGRHQAYFPGDIYNGRIEVVTSDGKHLKSRPVGISYDDGSNTVLIAQLKDATGTLVGSNQVVYADAFTTFKADLRYTYTRAGFEQDVILREQPPAPEQYGLNSATARLQILTEFFDAPEPAAKSRAGVRQSAASAAVLSFGNMKMIQGRAFFSGSTDAASRPLRGTAVGKSWQHLQNRTFLVEELPVQKVAAQLEQLSAASASAAKGAERFASAHRQLPPVPDLAAVAHSFEAAAAGWNRQPGLVLDYQTVDNYYTSGDFTLSSNQTYYVSGYCEIDGELTIQGGTVVKYEREADLMVDWVTCQTGPYNMATFTAVDDDSVGETISSSTGSPSGYYADAALDLMVGDGQEDLPSLSYLRIYYAETVIVNPESDIPLDLRDSQLSRCDVGICSYQLDDGEEYKPNFSCRNVLLDQMGTAAFAGEGFNAYVENCTFSGVGATTASVAFAETFSSDDPDLSDYDLTLLNCLGRDNIYWGFTTQDGSQTPLSGTDCYSNLTSSAFQTMGNGNYYLASGSPYRNAGTSSVDSLWVNGPPLLPELRQKTTYPPASISSYFGADTTLNPRVPRDTDAVDAGYHYDAVDYSATALIVPSGVQLTLTNGAVLVVADTNATLDGTVLFDQHISPSIFQEQTAAPGSVWIGGREYVAYIDADGDGLPDWWEMTYFGNYSQNATNDPDGDGVNNMQEYLNGSDPDQNLSFTVRLGGQYHNTTNIAGTFLVLNAVPGYESVVINTNDVSGAAWSNYDGNIHFNLGATDGVYQVWLGLKGHATNAPPVWMGTTVTLDRRAPALTLTNPILNNATGCVATPYIQLQGYADETLQSVTYDLSNAVMVVTNQAGQKLGGQFFDTNQWEYTTDYFQCYDILLTNGVNRITLHATDLAGNVTTTNFNVTLDYTLATNPIIQLTWPQDGMKVLGDSLTVRGWTEDSSAQVMAQIVNTNGETNVVFGSVERDGKLWAQNLPLSSGTNWITMSVTNAAGLGSVTNFMVVRSDVVVVLHAAGDLWSSSVLVNGSISDPNYTVWVNGVKATVDAGGTWSADGVPPGDSGTSSFVVTIYPPGEDPETGDGGGGSGGGSGGGGSGGTGGNPSDPNAPSQDFDVDKPSEVVMESAKWTWDSEADVDAGLGGAWEINHQQGHYSHESGGEWKEHFEAQDSNRVTTLTEDTTITLDTNGIGIWQHYEENGVVMNDGPYDGTPISIPLEEGTLSGKDWGTWSKTSEVKMALKVGGKAGVEEEVLVGVNASASEELLGTPDSRTIDPQDITIPGLGDTLGSDGWAYGTAKTGASVDVTPTTTLLIWNFSWPNTALYYLYIGLSTSTTNANLETDKPEVCVGQKVTFAADWKNNNSPSADADIWWHLPDKYVNKATNYSETCLTYVMDDALLTNQITQCWYVNQPGGSCSVRESLHFANGKTTTVIAKGSFTVYRPEKVGENMNQDFFNPTVNIPSPPLYATNVNGLLKLGDSQGGYARFWAKYKSAYPGEFQEAQVVQSYRKSGNDDPVDSGSLWWNDHAFDKGGIASTVSYVGGIAWAMQTDFPGKLLKAPQTVVNDVFKTYFQFKPAGDSIWVTMGRVNWSWSATSTYTSGQWNVPSGTAYSDPQYHDDDSFPLWDGEHP